MNVLVLSSRFPWPSYTGDRLRASLWLSALAPHARVALVAPGGQPLPAELRQAGFYPAAGSWRRGLRGGLTVLRRGLPWQTLLAAPYDWEGAIEAARRDFGTFDVTIVVLTRADPWAFELVDSERKILDAIDSLRRNAEERGKAASGIVRWFWKREASRQEKAETDCARRYDRIVVVNEEETAEFGARAVAVTNSIRVLPLDPEARRSYDFGFWGRLAYFANADAARWLIDEIWPAILARNPSATCVIGGADAPRALRRDAERRGIGFLSPVDDIAFLARSVRVALIPLRYGSGQSNKVLEAAEAGCTIVATRQALRGVASLVPHVRIADDVAGFVEAALDSLAPGAATASDGALRRLVIATHERGQILDQLARLAGCDPSVPVDPHSSLEWGEMNSERARA